MSASLHSRPSGFVSGSSKPSLSARARRVVQYRRILRLLVSKDLKVRYAGSALGYVWTILDPLLMSLVYWLVFEKVFHRGAGIGFNPYMIYLVSGLLAWTWFQGGVTGVTRALLSEAQMVRSSNVPRELWVLRVVASKGVEYVLGLPVLVVYAICYATAPSKYALLLPVGIALEALLLVGIGLILAPVTVLFRDAERVVPLIMRVLFYGSPVLYSISLVPQSFRTAYAYNPVVGFLTLSHAAFFPAALHEPVVRTSTVATLDTDGGQLVVDGVAQTHKVSTVIGHIDHWDWVWHSAVGAVVIFAVGVVVFVRLERSVLKEI